jgi:hypothetical protein
VKQAETCERGLSPAKLQHPGSRDVSPQPEPGPTAWRCAARAPKSARPAHNDMNDVVCGTAQPPGAGQGSVWPPPWVMPLETCPGASPRRGAPVSKASRLGPPHTGPPNPGCQVTADAHRWGWERTPKPSSGRTTWRCSRAPARGVQGSAAQVQGPTHACSAVYTPSCTYTSFACPGLPASSP